MKANWFVTSSLAILLLISVTSCADQQSNVNANNINDILNERIDAFHTLFDLIELDQDGGLQMSDSLNSMRLNETSGTILEILRTIVGSFNETNGDHEFPQGPRKETERQVAVREAMEYGLKQYLDQALGFDNLMPLTGTASNAQFDLAATLLDSFDSQVIMNFSYKQDEQLEYVQKMNLNPDHWNFFLGDIITIFGGLLGADYLSEDSEFLKQAQALGQLLLNNYAVGVNKVPFPSYNSALKQGVFKPEMPDMTIIAELGLQLEFNQLAHEVDNPTFSELPQALVDELLRKAEDLPLIPIYYDPRTQEFINPPSYTFGRYGDGFYEYIVKQYVQTGSTDEKLKGYFTKYYDNLIATLTDYTPDHVLYPRMIQKGEYAAIFDELACFLPGNLMLAADQLSAGTTEDVKRAKIYQGLAKQFTESCYNLFKNQPTGLCADEVQFDGDDVKVLDSQYKLRPETIESMYYMWYYTKDTKYQDWGWEIMQSVFENCKAEYGWAYIADVSVPESEAKQLDLTGPYFYAEMMKYAYLLFSENPLNEKVTLEEYVFNTEGHPLRIWTK